MAISQSLIESVVFELYKQASIEIPPDVMRALKKGYDIEDSLVAKGQFEAIMENINIAHNKQVGMCQDTGVPIIYADLGLKAQVEGDPYEAFTEAIKKATTAVPMRQNVINPLTKKNSGTNTGWGIPYVHWDTLPDKDYLDILAVTKGFGSEMRGSQCWVLSSEDVGRATVKAVLDVVADSMGEPCPPVIIGVGIGGFADSSMSIAKKALFRDPIGSRNPDPDVAALEAEIEKAVNELNLGPMGFGGKTYTLGVHAELSGSHTAVMPVSVIFQCWACRYAKARIYNDGRVEYITHPHLGGK
ncbi:MAG: fumarate hydratase [Peptococcaceae bacterium]|nr:fumarate hydratase [Peptococcaceae bacterium]